MRHDSISSAHLRQMVFVLFMRQPFGYGVAHEPTGSVGLIHPETHFTDEKAGLLRAATYRRLRRHWQFLNELVLFEIDHHVSYGVHVYALDRNPGFQQATSLYHPDTVERSLKHDGSGAEPGLKDDDGKWDLRPHASRIQLVDLTTLGTWHAVLEADDVPVGQSRMVYTVNRSTAAVLDKLSKAPRIGSLGLQFSRGWDESIDRKKGMFDSEWGVPESWDSVILQGPHLHVANPFYKQPNPTMLHNQDWTAVDLEALPPDAIPATSYKPRGDRAKYDAAYTHWQTEPEGSAGPSTDFYRIAWRRMAANTGERTLTPALIPPGPAHINGVHTVGGARGGYAELVLAAASMGSLLGDCGVRTTPKSEILFSVVQRLPLAADDRLNNWLLLRALRLNCVTSEYAQLWADCYTPDFGLDRWTSIESRTSVDLGHPESSWSSATPLRRAYDRRHAAVEIDALVALALEVSIGELCSVYRTQFPVLGGYDRGQYAFDANGRLVPSAILSAARRAKHDLSTEDRSARHSGSQIVYVYEPPFVFLDREDDLRDAYAEFERRLASKAEKTP